MGNLKYYKTPGSVVTELFGQLDLCDIKNIVDLGAGEGALLGQLYEENKYNKVAIEVDHDRIEILSSAYDSVYSNDLFKKRIRLKFESLLDKTLFVSNPPFGVVSSTKHLQKLMMTSALVDKADNATNFRMELVFLARAIEAAKKGDYVAFIVPASIVNQQRFSKVREVLVKNHGLYSCTLITENVFKNTEVRTAIIWFKPYSNQTTDDVNVFLEFNSRPLKIANSAFIKNGVQNALSNKAHQDTLASIVVNLKRGVSSKKSLLDRGIKHIHTTDLNEKHAGVVKIPSCFQSDEVDIKERYAKHGDILMARVGTRVVGKAAMFTGVKAVISDCVIRIRVTESKRDHLFKELISTAGQKWLQEMSTGSCARLLTYDVLNKFPIIRA